MGTADGVLRTRTVRRRPEEQRCDQRLSRHGGRFAMETEPELDDLAGEVVPAIDMPMAEPEVGDQKARVLRG